MIQGVNAAVKVLDYIVASVGSSEHEYRDKNKNRVGTQGMPHRVMQ